MGIVGDTFVHSSGRGATDGTTSTRKRGVQGRLAPRVSRTTIASVVVTLISFGLLWVVWLYASGLRDPRYLDGWILAGGVGVQLIYHVLIKSSLLSPKSAKRWRGLHIFSGYVLIAAFASHANFGLPDTAFEWALWTSFVLVSASGLIGLYLAWTLTARRGIADLIGYERIPLKREELALELHTIVTRSDPLLHGTGLPTPPHDGWIMDLYTTHLRDFFAGPQNFKAHLLGSQRPLKQLTDEIDALAQYVDQPGQDKLAAIKALVVEKDRLDFARVHHGLSRGWLFVHVPATYTMIVLAILHVVVVYAFSSGDW